MLSRLLLLCLLILLQVYVSQAESNHVFDIAGFGLASNFSTSKLLFNMKPLSPHELKPRDFSPCEPKQVVLELEPNDLADLTFKDAQSCLRWIQRRRKRICDVIRKCPVSITDGADKSAAECVICWERPITHKLLPCGHAQFCRLCSERVERCPLCRADVSFCDGIVPSPAWKRILQIFLRKARTGARTVVPLAIHVASLCLLISAVAACESSQSSSFYTDPRLVWSCRWYYSPEFHDRHSFVIYSGRDEQHQASYRETREIVAHPLSLYTARYLSMSVVTGMLTAIGATLAWLSFGRAASTAGSEPLLAVCF
eukprot:gnl/TRDRNA2_/TRDRNA2_136683_c0_seq1.p1 gnl/TRDRNA2_/TRDRNA2_136683_c0~~gnl/TRDRNA2_/TRDRNA2_136683_c0_seq1.p1  ORF type:complete len:313 (-),score=23.91 gnl/TRDRNA2_/TRDRNA2_136683_c0_seq1:49-987(-)